MAIEPSFLSDNRYVFAGLAGGGFAPLATWLLGLPAIAAIPGAVLVFAGVLVLLQPKKMFEDLDADQYEAGQLALAGEVLSEAEKDLRRLTVAAHTITKVPVKEKLVHLKDMARRVTLEVERDPSRLRHVRRLLTYYLPASARMAEGYVAVEKRVRPDHERVAAAEQMLDRLDDVFTDYNDRLVTTEIEGLDLEIKLLDDATRQP